jgi:DnaJ-class molecular chaperone
MTRLDELTRADASINIDDDLFDLDRPCPACKGRCYVGKEPCDACYGEGYAPR